MDDKTLQTLTVLPFILSDINLTASLALTADKLAGGPLSEYLKKTREEAALRCLQFWEDSQEYLSPREDFGSLSKYNLGKTLIATYIAPDSPRKVTMSRQTRDDLMRLLPLERGSQLLSTVLQTSVQVKSMANKTLTQRKKTMIVLLSGFTWEKTADRVKIKFSQVATRVLAEDNLDNKVCER